MAYKIIRILAIWCCDGKETEDEIEVICFGLSLIWDNVFRLLIIVLIGILIGEGEKTVVSLLCFCSLRSQAGGVHMKSGIGCFLMMELVIQISIVVANLINIMPDWWIIVECIIGIVIIWIYAPNGGQYVELMTEERKKKKKRYAFVLWLFWCLVAVTTKYKKIVFMANIFTVLTLVEKRNANQSTK